VSQSGTETSVKHLMHVILVLMLCVGTALGAGVQGLSVREAKALIDKTPNLFILDVRTPDENRQARLKNSVLIPVDDLERRLNEVPRNRPVLVYCAVGSRSMKAADFLARKGFREVYQLNDGIVGWYRAGLAVEK
jgi:rhodanese-related sulfurtransferase